MAALRSPKPLVKVRVLAGMPNYGCVGKLVTPADCKSAAPRGTPGSTPGASTKFYGL